MRTCICPTKSDPRKCCDCCCGQFERRLVADLPGISAIDLEVLIDNAISGVASDG